jgi:toxin ParE1/3/4
MDEKVYRIYKTKQFAYQFDDIGFYIAESAGAPEPALDYMRRVEEAVSKLAYFPNRGSRPRDALLRMQGYRYIIVGRHLIFYKCQEEERRILVVAIIDKRRKYEELL